MANSVDPDQTAPIGYRTLRVNSGDYMYTAELSLTADRERSG